MDKTQKQTLFCYFIILAGVIYISGFNGILDFTIGLAVYSTIFYVIRGIYISLKTPDYDILSLKNYNLFLNYFLNRVGRLLILFVIVLGGFCFYQNDINPAKMPIYQFTNGDKKITFISMSHIGTPDFYKKVKDTIINFKKDGYVYYFEGVKPGNEENSNKFNNALGMTFDSGTYKSMSKLYGLTQQDNSMFLGLVNDKDYNVDTSIDEIMKMYEKSNVVNTNSGLTQTPVDVSKLVEESIKSLTPRELSIVRYINRAFVNMIVKSEGIQSTISSEFANQKLFDVILNKRNEILKEKILNSEDKNIIITYGMLHFDGLFDELVKSDIKWRIQKIDYYSPLK